MSRTQSREKEKKDNNISAHLSLLLSRFSSFLHSTHAVSQTVFSWLFGAVFSCQCGNNDAGVLFFGLMIVALASPFKYHSFALQRDFSGLSIMPMINVAAVFQTLTTYCFQHLSKVPHNSYKTVLWYA